MISGTVIPPCHRRPHAEREPVGFRLTLSASPAAAKRLSGGCGCSAAPHASSCAAGSSSGGSSSGGTRTRSDRARPGIRSTKPRSARVRTMPCTDGGVTRKNRCMSASAGGSRRIRVYARMNARYWPCRTVNLRRCVSCCVTEHPVVGSFAQCAPVRML